MLLFIFYFLTDKLEYNHGLTYYISPFFKLNTLKLLKKELFIFNLNYPSFNLESKLSSVKI